jgi:hypothetical protein
VGRESSVGIATGYGLEGPGSESRWGQDFRHMSRPALGPTQPPVQWVFPGGKKRPGRDADPSPPSSVVVMNGRSYTSIPPMSRTACTEPQCLYKGAFYLYPDINYEIHTANSTTLLSASKTENLRIEVRGSIK